METERCEDSPLSIYQLGLPARLAVSNFILQLDD